jgi:hypothetical protein
MDERDGLIVRMTGRKTVDHFSSRAAANIIIEITERAATHAKHVAPATTIPQNSIRPIFTFFVFYDPTHFGKIVLEAISKMHIRTCTIAI